MMAKELKRRDVSVTIIFSAAILLMASTVWAKGEGTAGAPFLKIGTSSRAEAMGGAFTAVVNDVDATYWNPAGLMQLKRSTIGLTHLEWFEDIRYEYISYADKFDYIGAVGATIGYLYLGDIPKTFETPTGDYDPNSSGTFGASDLAVSLAWAGNLGMREHKAGLAVKIIQESIDANSSYSLALDVGDQLLIADTRWYRKLAAESWAAHLIPSVVGLSIKNLGTPVKFFNQNDPLPLSMNLGLAYQFLDKDLTGALDLVYQTVDSLAAVHVDGEYWIDTGIQSGTNQNLEVALRAGYRVGYTASAAPGFSLGLGMVYSSLGLDYVFMPFGDLGSTHRISLKFSWGEILKDKIHLKRKRMVKRKLSASDQALEQTASQMMRQKKTMDSKTVVQKSAVTPQTLTTLEAKRPEDQAVAKETKSLGAEVEVPAKGAEGVKLPKGIKTSGTKVDSDLIAKITSGQKARSEERTRSQYTRRTQEDAVRAARREAEIQGQAFDAVEAAAKEEAVEGKEETRMVTRTTIYFAQDSSKLNDKYLYALDKIAVSFDRYPQRTILVHGYTADNESDKNNLSLGRAKAVKDYLVQIKSIPNNKISIKGFGDKDPVVPNNSDQNRARNRRVRVQLIQTGN